MREHAAGWVECGFVLLPLVVAALGLWGVRYVARERFASSVAVVAFWFALWGVLAASGVLARFDVRPPPLALLIVSSLVAGIWLGLSRLGASLALRVPLWALVLAQGFRFPLELLMHETARDHVMPNALSFTGYNFDIVTGASAFIVAYVLRRGGSPLWAWLWGGFGSLCLAVIAAVALLSSPAIAAFGPDELNTFVTRWPFVWLPSVLVVFALAGHVVVFRQLTAAGLVRSLRPT